MGQIIEPGEGVAEVEQTPSGLIVRAPMKPAIGSILFMFFIMAVFTIAAIAILVNTAISYFFRGELPDLFTVLWGGLVLAFFIIPMSRSLIWSVFGVEVTNLSREELSMRYKGLLFSKSKVFRLSEIKHLRLAPADAAVSQWAQITSGSHTMHTIAFDYGRSTHGFGAGLDEADAQHVVDAILTRFPALGRE